MKKQAEQQAALVDCLKVDLESLSEGQRQAFVKVTEQQEKQADEQKRQDTFVQTKFDLLIGRLQACESEMTNFATLQQLDDHKESHLQLEKRIEEIEENFRQLEEATNTVSARNRTTINEFPKPITVSGSH